MKILIVALLLALSVSAGRIEEMITEDIMEQYMNNPLAPNVQDIWEKIGLTLLLGSNCFKDVAGEILVLDEVIKPG